MGIGSIERRALGLVSLALLVAVAQGTRADMLDTSGLKTHEICAECHSLDGNSRMQKFPKLAGLSVGYMVKQLKDLQSGARHNDSGPMQAMVEELTVDAMTEAATHFGAQARRPVVEAPPADAVAAGRALFEGGGGKPCESCHGLAAAPVEDAPILFSQHPEYIVRQLRAFQSGARANDPGAVMRRIAANLSEADIAALAAYLAQVPPPATSN